MVLLASLNGVSEDFRALNLLLLQLCLELLLIALGLQKLSLRLLQVFRRGLLVHLKTDDILLLDTQLSVQLIDLRPQAVLLLTDGLLELTALVFKQL